MNNYSFEASEKASFISKEIEKMLQEAYSLGFEAGVKSTQKKDTNSNVVYVDMGLPSGLKWALLPQKLNYIEASSNYKLPTYEQLCELYKNCHVRSGYIDGKSLLVLKSNINNKELFYYSDYPNEHDYIWCTETFLAPGEACVMEVWNFDWHSERTRKIDDFAFTFAIQ